MGVCDHENRREPTHTQGAIGSASQSTLMGVVSILTTMC
jgi:hypothetical protein